MVRVPIVATGLRLAIVIACTLVLAAVVWVVSGYVLTLPLGLAYGWSGHPSIPAAPDFVYILLYLVILPAASIDLSWRVLRRFARRRGRDQALGSRA
jgi:hypothetical protein